MATTGRSTSRGGTGAILALCAILLAVHAHADAPSTPPKPRAEERLRSEAPDAPPQTDDPILTIQALHFTGLTGRGLTESDLLNTPVQLRDIAPAFGPPQRDVPIVTKPLRDLIGQPIHTSALQTIVAAVSKAHTDRHLAAVRVTITRDDVDRLAREGVLVIHIEEGTVGAVLTHTGPAAPEGPLEQRVAAQSPVRQGDMVNLAAVDRYTRMLERQPWRRVDAALSPGERPGEVNLEYIVSQRDPLTLYAQISNTGTPETTDWRERFGLTHYSLTGHDDVLSLDYVTGDFDLVHAVTASYDVPLPDHPELRLRGFGSWNRYDASQVGLDDANFTGEGYDAGGELQWTFAYAGGFLFDAVGGMRFKHVETDNQLADVHGDADFLLPYVGVRAERAEPGAFTAASLTIESNLSRLIGTDEDDLAELGRADASDQFTTLRGDLSQSLYLQPLFQGGDQLGAHELYGSIRGQYVLDRNRVAPNFTETAGGFYSVRGYPESFIAGDDAIIGTIEYRLHLPQLFPTKPRAEERPRSEAPDSPPGSTNWDLLFRGFIDAAAVNQIDNLSFEDDATLLSAGIGAELRLRHNLSLRADWAWALRTTDNGDDTVTPGSSRVHLSLTITY